MARVIAYIDGFNLYFGMKARRWQRFYWLDVQQLAQRLLKPEQTLVRTKYFTSRVSATPRDPGKSKRQSCYIEALGTLGGVDVFYGHYLRREMQCLSCGARWETHDEKMTDVNIAVQLLLDAFQNEYDTALLVSGDSDLTGPIEAVRGFFPQKRVVVAFPPERTSRRLQDVANSYLTIGHGSLAASQLPDRVRKPDGYVLERPTSWR